MGSAKLGAKLGASQKSAGPLPLRPPVESPLHNVNDVLLTTTAKKRAKIILRIGICYRRYILELRPRANLFI